MTETEEDIRSIAEEGLKELPWGFASFAGAVGILAGNLHDFDHESTHDEAMRGTYKAMRSASRLLLNSASIQSHQYGFSITDAFDRRLATLRSRFDIPEPPELTK